MKRKISNNQHRVFISHASANLKAAQQVEHALHTAGFDVWLDQSDIRVGVLLGKELQQAIQASQVVILLWSKPASTSRWVATEVLTAFHLNRFILPCVLSATELPQFISRSVYLDLRRGRISVLNRLGDQVMKAPRSRNEFLAVNSYQTKELSRTINQIYADQAAMLDLLDKGDVADAKRLQAKLDPRMRAAEKHWRFDPTILNLAGYHRKNTYMLNHWQEYCAGRFPRDRVLREGERYFIETLFIKPTDYGALNGLGNIFLFEGELDAAEFFVEKAISCAAEDDVDYTDAKHDLNVIRSRSGTLRSGRARIKGIPGPH